MINKLLPKSLANLIGVGLIAISSIVLLFLTDRASHASDTVHSTGQSLKSVKSPNSAVTASAVDTAVSTKEKGVTQFSANSASTVSQSRVGSYCIQNGVAQNGVQGKTAANPSVCMLSQFGQMFNPMFGAAKNSPDNQSVQPSSFQSINPMAMMLRWCSMFSRPTVQSSI